MAKLSKAAVKMLEDAGCNEVADDYLVIGDAQAITIMLSHRAVADLNRQARGEDSDALDSTGAKEHKMTFDAAESRLQL